MTTMDNHYEIMGRILAHLIKVGLRRVEFTEDDAYKILSNGIETDEDLPVIFADILRWMLEENLIRSGRIHLMMDSSYIFQDVQLTSRGIAAVQAKPTDPSLGESVEETVAGNDELDASTYTKIGSFVGGLMGGFTQALSG
ncbi:hypothetical protein [Rhizobium ruizarguesonis]|uniref:hypothetical protein n=1 Tax=Rhizobium ruizarguesonis TaxID=2081791 RepID=UPI00103044E6|nr:hypothetical protein [Rhizobium ruizarguesonis]TAV18922.1 hypothetical protein ELI35_38160 [Rhizobium ruizarguesonis]